MQLERKLDDKPNIENDNKDEEETKEETSLSMSYL
jgi:hypothetical protein